MRMKSELVLKRRMVPNTTRSVSRAHTIESRESGRSLRDSESRFADLFRSKFERLIQENKVEQVLHTELHRKSSIFENVRRKLG